METNEMLPQPAAQLTAAGIPRSLAPCFQEYDLEQLDPALHGDLIIERVLGYGDRRELGWLFRRYGRARVTDWVHRLGVRRLPWRRYNLWCVLLELPPARRPRSEGQRIWPYRPWEQVRRFFIAQAQALGQAWFGDQKE